MFRRTDRYTATAVARPLVPVTGVLLLVFASLDTARTLADFESNQLATTTLVQLVGLKTLIALDVLLPLALYLAAIIGLAGLHQSHQIIALRSVGVPPVRTALGVSMVAVGVAITAGAVSLFARPWAYNHVNALESAITSDADISDLIADHFRLQNNGRMLYARRHLENDSGIDGLVVYERSNGRSDFTLAAQARQLSEDRLLLSDTRTYSLDRRGTRDRLQQLSELTVDLRSGYGSDDTGRKALSTRDLLGSKDPVEIAERQWRFSRPVAAVILGLAAVPLSATTPRRGPYARLVVAFILFALYFALGDMARRWVEQGTVPALPGLWWPHALLALAIILTALLRRGFR